MYTENYHAYEVKEYYDGWTSYNWQNCFLEEIRSLVRFIPSLMVFQKN